MTDKDIPEPMDGVTPPSDDGDEPLDEPKGQMIGSYMGTVVLRDPIAGDVSRAGRPLVPMEPTVTKVEEVIKAALELAGYAVTVDLTATHK